MSAVIDEDHYILVADLRKIIPVPDTEIDDGTVDTLIVSQSKYMVGITNRQWSEDDFLFESVSNLVGRLVAVQLLQRRGKFVESQILKETIDDDIKVLLKSPYLHADDTGAGQKSVFINVHSRDTNWYKNGTDNTRYKSDWASR